MKVSFDYSQLAALANRTLQEKAAILKEAQDDLRKVSLALERGIKDEMPVDTGRARASWGHWTIGDIQRISTDSDFGPGDAVYEVRDHGLTIEQGTNVEYVQYLNEGHSTQAPAGFIDRRAKIARQVLNGLVEKIFGRQFKR